jgi:hypothetical protein
MAPLALGPELTLKTPTAVAMGFASVEKHVKI